MRSSGIMDNDVPLFEFDRNKILFLNSKIIKFYSSSVKSSQQMFYFMYFIQ